jgi:tol-pal system protein YbgF
MIIRTIAAVVVALLATTMASSPVALAESTKDRLDALERKLDSRSLLEMLNRIEQLQADVRQLRGDVELQTYRLEELQQQQREQYLDTDRRLQQLETGLVGGTGTAGSMSPASATLPDLGSPQAQPPVPMVTAPPPQQPSGMLPAPEPQAQPPVPMVTAPPPRQPATEPLASPPGAAVTNTAAAQAEYDTALAILREGRYAEAAQAFNRFLAANPGSAYADNASYWLGETYYVTRDFDQALGTFQGLVSRYPQSSKVSDSHLKMGYIYYEKKDWKAARENLELVVNQFPGTTTARLAADRLQRMKQEGH